MATLLDSREISALFWTGVVLLGIGSTKRLRSAVLRVLRSLLHPKVLTIYLAAFAFGGLVLLAMTSVFGYSWNLVKSAVVWQFSAGLALITRFPEASTDKFFKSALTDNLKASAVVGFVMGLTPFSLVTELVLLPALTFVALLHAFSENEPSYRQVHRLLGAVLGVIGVYMVIRTLVVVLWQPTTHLTAATILEFSVAPIMSVLFVPFIYAVALFAAYDDVFLRLRVFTKDRSVRRFAKLAIAKKFHFQLRRLGRWSKRKLKFESVHEVVIALNEG